MIRWPHCRHWGDRSRGTESQWRVVVVVVVASSSSSRSSWAPLSFAVLVSILLAPPFLPMRAAAPEPPRNNAYWNRFVGWIRETFIAIMHRLRVVEADQASHERRLCVVESEQADLSACLEDVYARLEAAEALVDGFRSRVDGLEQQLAEWNTNDEW